MTDDGWYERLIETVRVAASGCCGDESWRGRFCPYHMGYIDGAAAEHYQPPVVDVIESL